MNDLNQQRLKDIKESLEKDIDLLRGYEELKRVEKDPRTLLGYDNDIKRTREDIKKLEAERKRLEKAASDEKSSESTEEKNGKSQTENDISPSGGKNVGKPPSFKTGGKVQEINEVKKKEESKQKDNDGFWKKMRNVLIKNIGILIIIGISASIFISIGIEHSTPRLSISQELFLEKDVIYLDENTDSLFKIHISNGTPAALKWNIKSDQSWMIVNPESGLNEREIVIKIKTFGLNSGNHRGNITINSNGGIWTKELNLSVLPLNRTTSIPRSRTLGINEVWDIERGYSIVPQFIKESSPKQVLLALYRNGNKLDEKLLAEGEIYNWNNMFGTKITEIFTHDGSTKVTLTNTTIS